MSLASNSITDIGASALAEVIARDNDALQALRLSRNKIREAGGVALLKIFRTNRFLRLLQLRHNPVSLRLVKGFAAAMQRMKGSCVVNGKELAMQNQNDSSSLSRFSSSCFGPSVFLTLDHAKEELPPRRAETPNPVSGKPRRTDRLRLRASTGSFHETAPGGV